MIKLESHKMINAINRAKAVRPRVRRLAERSYSVSGSKGDTYTVVFVVANGHKLAECNCKAGEAGMLCYHVAAAAALNIAVHSVYARPSETPKAPATEKAELVAKIMARWSGKYSQFGIMEGLIKRFGVSSLDQVHIGYLRQLAALA